MKFYLFIGVLVVFLLHFCEGKQHDLNLSLEILKQIESGNNAQAVGDGGKAVGVLQIWPVMVEEVNRISGKKFTLEDRFNVDKSEEMAKIYLNYYLNLEEKRGHQVNHKTVAFLWNGGPAGRIYARDQDYGNEQKRQNLENYWKKYLTQYKLMVD